MIENWREILYPLGFLSSLAFTARFLVQWISSEIRQQSYVTQVFWKLSCAGNVLLLLHSLIQAQFHVAIVQTCNGVISWRNLNLMQPTENQYSFKATSNFLMLSLFMTFTFFFIQGYFVEGGTYDWFRVPVWHWQNAEREEVPYLWHLMGFGGLVLFNSRFWIQWWLAEKRKESYLGPSFWWMSLIGDIFCLAYFLRIGDIVNVIGPGIGLVPYVRNLMLIYKSPKSTVAERSP